MMRFLLFSALWAPAAFFALTPTLSKGQERADAARHRIAALSREVESLTSPTASEKEYRDVCATKGCQAAPAEVRDRSKAAQAKRLAVMNRLVAQIHGEIDAFVYEAFDPNTLDRNAAERAIRDALDSVSPTGPAAFVLDGNGRSLLIAYAVQKGRLMGRDATTVTLRAYNAVANRFRLTDATGGDMDGYGNIAVKQLPSPTADSIWFIVSGQMTGANGPNVRMRAYAYDGMKFRTTWMPENVWGNFTIGVTANGFTVDGNYYRSNETRHDFYAVDPDCLYRVVR